MCHVAAVTGCLSVDIETFSKAKEETRAEDSASHKQVRRENEHNPMRKMSLSHIEHEKCL